MRRRDILHLSGNKEVEEKEKIRLRIEVLIKALSERKESNQRIHEIIKMIDSKVGDRRSTPGHTRNPAGG